MLQIKQKERMKLHFALIVALVCVFAVSGCATPRNSLLKENENGHTNGYRYNHLNDNTLIAATFSGGGMRAAALAYGALMAFKETEKSKNGQASSPVEESISDPCSCYKNESENEGEPQLGDHVDLVNNGLSDVKCARTKETKKSEIVRGLRLIDEVDLVSSVSGGSVTAAYWALKGSDRLEDLKKQFLCKNVEGELIKTAVNPVTWLQLSMPSYSRIDVLRNYFEEELFESNSSGNSDSEKHRYWDYDYDETVFDEVFEGATYKDLLNNNRPKRPYVVLNTTDMATGKVFSFTQEMFDFLCANLTKFKMADAVAASAAYPVVLTALTVKNYWPDPECQVASKLKERIQASEKVKGEALMRAEEQVKAKRRALVRAEEQKKAKEQALGDAKEQERARELDLVRAKEQVKAKEEALDEAKEQVKERERALKEIEEQKQTQQQALNVVKAEEQVRAKVQALVRAKEQARAKDQALKEAEEQEGKLRLEMGRLDERVKAKEQTLEEAEEQVGSRKQALEEAEKQVREKGRDLKVAEEQLKAKEQALKEAEEQELALVRAEEQKKAKKQALKEAEDQVEAKREALVKAEEQKKAKEQALAEAEKQVEPKGEALVRAEEQVKARKKALREAEGQVRVKEHALKEAKEQARAKNQALKEAEEQEGRLRLEMGRLDERVKAKEQALEDAKEQERARKLDVVRAEEQVKAKKEALREAEERVKAKKQALEEAEGEVILRKLQKNLRALRARPHDYWEEKSQYVHFLDGGTADNLGLTPLLGLLDSIVEHELPKYIAVIAVNARSEQENDYGKRNTPPNVIDTLFTTIGVAIDSTSFVLLEQLEHIREGVQKIGTNSNSPKSEMFIVDVSLDSIKDDECRRWFQNIPTRWSLDPNKIDALIAVGRALVLESGEYAKLVNNLGYNGYPKPVETVSKVCSKVNGDTT